MNIEGITLHLHKNFLIEKLLGARVDKIYQPDRMSILFQVRNHNQNMFLYANCGGEAPHIRLVDKAPENPEVPPPFCMLLRKHLENGRITQISQPRLDRVIIFDIDTLGQGNAIITKQLVFELTGKSSNIIFLQDEIIMGCTKQINAMTSRYRQILPGRPYLPPPPQSGLDILTHTASEITKTITASKKPLLNAVVSATLGIGPVSAGEIIWRAGLPPNMFPDQLDDKDRQALDEVINSIFTLIKHGDAPAYVALDGNSHLLALTPFSPDHLSPATVKSFPTVNQAIEYALRLQRVKPETNALLGKQLRSEIAKIEKKILLLEQELETAENADDLRNFADNIMSQPHLIPKGASECTLTDLLSRRPLHIALNPLLNPIENAQQYYKSYNKARRAVEQLKKQLYASGDFLEYLSSVEFALNQNPTINELAEIKSELVGVGLLKEKKSRPPRLSASPPVKLTRPSGAVIYIGKNNRQNDQLTFKIAKPSDIWLHAKNIPGSHVILQSAGTPSEEDIRDAALLAAWFSKAKGSSNIPIDYTLKKYVRKPSGAKPGFVIYENQKTIQVTTDEENLKNLLG